MSVVFWEGNDGSQDGWPLSTEYVQNLDLTDDAPVPNDETRSCTIVDADAGTTIKVFDSSDANTDNDWAEIEILDEITVPVVVNTFESTTQYGGGSVRVTYNNNKDKGLDGKVSYISIKSG